FGVDPNVVNVHGVPLQRCARCAAATSRCEGIPLGEFSELWRDVVGGYGSKNLAIKTIDEPSLGLAQSDSVLGQRLEHRLEIEGGTPNHLEQLAGRRLLLEGHPELTVACLQLRKQPHILNGDHCLIGKGVE